MEPTYVCFFETRSHTYAGYGTTPEEAKKVCLKGYNGVIRRVSEDSITEDEIKEFNNDSFIEEVVMGKCLVDDGRMGWY